MSKRLLPLIPSDLLVRQVLPLPDRVVVYADPRSPTATCPLCSRVSRRVHSRYERALADLPCQGCTVSIRVQARRFRCTAADCPRRIFAERLPAAAARPWTRRTQRLADVQRHLGLALGGQAGARLAARLAMPVGGDTLLRLVRRAAPEVPPNPRVLGVDDWAWRRGHRYGTILVDLERRRVIDLLPDREAETLARWLAARPGVEVVSRDRAAAYADATRRGAPQAMQVADRWHLLENLGKAIKTALDRHGPKLRKARRATPSPASLSSSRPGSPPPMTSAERRRWEGMGRRRVGREEVLHLHRAGVAIKEIARRLRVARNTVRRLVRGGDPAALQSRGSVLAPYQALLERRWAEGCRNGAQLWRELRETGFGGGLRVVTEWAQRQRLEGAPGREVLAAPAPPARRTALLLTRDPTTWTAEESTYLEHLFAIAPELARAHSLARRFTTIVQERQPDALGPWLEDARDGELSSFAEGLCREGAAVRAALETEWSNGQVEGQVTRLKLVKRSMYGRAKLDLLRARVMAA